MRAEPNPNIDFDDPIIWIYDPNYQNATEDELARDPLADFDRPMTVVDKQGLARLIEIGQKIEFV